MDHVWLNILSVLIVFGMAIISPGPNFILVSSTAFNRFAKEGLFTAFGVSVGSALFTVAGLLGLILVMNSLPYFSTCIRYIGGGYLVCLGFLMAIQPSGPQESINNNNSEPVAFSAWRSFIKGLLTNLTNPKAWAFYFSLFTLVVQPGFPLWAKIFLCTAMFIISFSWYGLIALIISRTPVKENFYTLQHWMNRGLGAFLIFIGVRLVFIQSK